MALEQHVYIIGADRAGPLKIGIAVNPQNRCRELQTGHPSTLRVYWTFGPWQAGIAARMERVIHRLLAPRRMAGEWFFVPIEQAMAALWIAEHDIPTYGDHSLATDQQLTEWANYIDLRQTDWWPDVARTEVLYVSTRAEALAAESAAVAAEDPHWLAPEGECASCDKRRAALQATMRKRRAAKP